MKIFDGWNREKWIESENKAVLLRERAGEKMEIESSKSLTLEK